MSLIKLLQSAKLIVGVSAVWLGSQIALSQPGQTQSLAQFSNHLAQNENLQQRIVWNSSSQPPAGKGGPPISDPGGPRPSVVCKNNLPLMALAPSLVANQTRQEPVHWGLTVQKSPTFWFYVPYEPKLITSIKLELRQGDRSIHTQTVSIPQVAGIIMVPVKNYTLETGAWYQAYLFVEASCSSTAQDETRSAQTWVLRQDLNLTQKRQLDQAAPLSQQAAFYAQNGFWYDVLSTTAQMKCLNSRDQNWENLLRAAKLETFRSEAIVDGCAPEKGLLPVTNQDKRRP